MNLHTHECTERNLQTCSHHFDNYILKRYSPRTMTTKFHNNCWYLFGITVFAEILAHSIVTTVTVLMTYISALVISQKGDVVILLITLMNITLLLCTEVQILNSRKT